MCIRDSYKGNKAQLQAFVEQLAGLNEDDYSQKTWLVFEEALNNANVVLANENAMQEEVDETYTKLVKAFLELRLIPNKDLLADLINQAESLNANDYTAASYAKLNTCLLYTSFLILIEQQYIIHDYLKKEKVVFLKLLVGK